MRRDKEILPVKLYYRIGEVAGLVGVEPHVLRYWESEFPTIRPQKSRSGQRVYSRRDVETLMRVKDLLYAQRFTIAGARQHLRTGFAESAALPEVEMRRDNACPQRASPLAAPEAALQIEVAPVHSDAQHMRAALLAVRERLVALLETLDISRYQDGLSDGVSASEDNSIIQSAGSRS
ncbi:MAG TPA: MerR family transcriptional regulator [Polyangiaceae bacterium]